MRKNSFGIPIVGSLNRKINIPVSVFLDLATSKIQRPKKPSFKEINPKPKRPASLRYIRPEDMDLREKERFEKRASENPEWAKEYKKKIAEIEKDPKKLASYKQKLESKNTQKAEYEKALTAWQKEQDRLLAPFNRATQDYKDLKSFERAHQKEINSARSLNKVLTNTGSMTEAFSSLKSFVYEQDPSGRTLSDRRRMNQLMSDLKDLEKTAQSMSRSGSSAREIGALNRRSAAISEELAGFENKYRSANSSSVFNKPQDIIRGLGRPARTANSILGEIDTLNANSMGSKQWRQARRDYVNRLAANNNLNLQQARELEHKQLMDMFTKAFYGWTKEYWATPWGRAYDPSRTHEYIIKGWNLEHKDQQAETIEDVMTYFLSDEQVKSDLIYAVNAQVYGMSMLEGVDTETAPADWYLNTEPIDSPIRRTKKEQDMYNSMAGFEPPPYIENSEQFSQIITSSLRNLT